MKKKVGDTLIEVTLAIGIFSMVAITVASVINGSTSSAQGALETTVTREEIDAQAEALRFIHSSYIAGGDSNADGEDRYAELWRYITSLAKNRAESLDFSPATCSELYDNDSLTRQGAFVINTNNLAALNSYQGSSDFDALKNEIVITPTIDSTNRFFTASTYPRLVYSNPLSGDDTLLGQGTGTQISRVEGLYIIPFQDDQSTVIVDQDGIGKRSAYYDFYIRSCWFAPGADRPSTISTVIRLYDPDAITNPGSNYGDTSIEEATDPNSTYLQDYTAERCQAEASNSNITLTDRRDGNNYSVRWMNNSCWMVSNLNFALSNNMTLDPSSSNVSSPIQLGSVGDLQPEFYYAQPRTIAANGGRLYNYCAATAGQICHNSSAGTATQSICPAGWHLPTSSEFQSVASRFPVTLSAQWYGYTSEATPNWGIHYGDYYWSASSSSNSRYYFRTSDDTLKTANGFHAFYIRCTL
ncbi:MAG: FISUMP domain-containing protein [Candidatus Saccharibacteria bacterium]|nr:FISUMP domain-containing protein [Candidatus Saccharibacteria bacterium]